MTNRQILKEILDCEDLDNEVFVSINIRDADNCLIRSIKVPISYLRRSEEHTKGIQICIESKDLDEEIIV